MVISLKITEFHGFRIIFRFYHLSESPSPSGA